MRFLGNFGFAVGYVLLWNSCSVIMINAFTLTTQKHLLLPMERWKVSTRLHSRSNHNDNHFDRCHPEDRNSAADRTISSDHANQRNVLPPSPGLPERVLTLFPLFWFLSASPALAAGTLPSALWAYAHFSSIVVIFGCLIAEKTLVKAGMTVQEEELVVRLDLVYGLMVALLYVTFDFFGSWSTHSLPSRLSFDLGWLELYQVYSEQPM